MRKELLIFFCLIFNLSIPNPSGAQDFTQLSSEAEFTLLTCSPGADLYSVFGHSAIRLKDPLNGIDSVYNYGTFDFNTENFYIKFARGKLDYTLSRQAFGWFQYGYIEEGRSIDEQLLNLTPDEEQEFYEILETNYLPQNRDYKYHFFFDNCATKIRDKVKLLLGDRLTWQHPVDTSRTFRELLDVYLVHMPWSDFGIDLALGMPCDDTLQPGQAMFLPDGLFKEFEAATLDRGALVVAQQQILPRELILTEQSIFTPAVVFWIFFGITLAITFFEYLIGKRFYWFDRIVILLSGLLGLMIFLLWFATDHTTTINNLNILWAIPINLVFLFFIRRRMLKVGRTYFKIHTILLLLVLASWSLIPQNFHEAAIPIVLSFVLVSFKLGWQKAIQY